MTLFGYKITFRGETTTWHEDDYPYVWELILRIEKVDK